MDVSFYQLHAPLEKFLPKLLEKIYAQGQRIGVCIENEERLSIFETLLWTYATLSFLPHGSQRTFPEKGRDQPIWLTTEPFFSNTPGVIVVTSEEIIESVPDSVTRLVDVIEAFEGCQERGLTRFRHYQEAGHECTLWREDASGKWFR